MTSQFIYVVTTDCGDDERAFTNQSDASPTNLGQSIYLKIME